MKRRVWRRESSRQPQRKRHGPLLRESSRRPPAFSFHFPEVLRQAAKHTPTTTIAPMNARDKILAEIAHPDRRASPYRLTCGAGAEKAGSSYRRA